MNSQGDGGPHDDAFAKLVARLQSLDPESLAILRLVLAKEHQATDIDNKILDELSDVLREKFAAFAQELLALIEAKKRAAAHQHERVAFTRAPVSDTVPTRYSVTEVAKPIVEGLRESVVRANAEVMRRVEEAGRLPKQVVLATIDMPIRCYYQLLGLTASTAIEVKHMHNNLTPRQQDWLHGVSQNLVSDLIRGSAGGVVVAAIAKVWAVLS